MGCLPNPGPTGGPPAGEDAQAETVRLVVRNDNDEAVNVRVFSGGAQVERLWVRALARDSAEFRRALVSGRSRLQIRLDETGSSRSATLEPISLPTGAAAVVVVVRSVLSMSYSSVR